MFGLGLWLSAVEVSRRRNYGAFKTLHHVSFWGFMVCGCCHYWSMVWWFLPGLVLYGVDGVFRIYQTVFGSSSSTVQADRSPVQVLQAAASGDASICSLVLQSRCFATAACGALWVCVPEISWFQWHPFDYVAIPWTKEASKVDACAGAAACAGGPATSAMLLHIKAYNG